MSRVPERMCVACRQMRPKPELMRVYNSDGAAVIDPKGKGNGRGAYICKNADCLKKARKIRALERGIGVSPLTDEVFAALEAYAAQ